MLTKLIQNTKLGYHTYRADINVAKLVFNRAYVIIDRIFFARPLIGGSIFASFKGITADMFVQASFNKQNQLDFVW